MSELFALRRARLELDRTLRGRSFVGRALTGFLQAHEYLALIEHFRGLLGASCVGPLLEAANHDLDCVAPAASGGEVSQSLALALYPRLLGRGQRRQRHGRLIASALLGTSWTHEAASRLELRYQGATGFLARLHSSAFSALEVLRREPPPSQDLHALTELTRGAILGIVTHLETSCPAPLQRLGAFS